MVTAAVTPRSQWRHRRLKQWAKVAPGPCRAAAPVCIGWTQQRRTAIRMVKRVWSRTLIRRRRVLEHARELARTGKYPDHLSILTEVRQLPDSRMVEERWFQDPDFLRQLDLTCAEAQELRRPTRTWDERRPAATCANGITGAKIATARASRKARPAGEARAKGVKGRAEHDAEERANASRDVR